MRVFLALLPLAVAFAQAPSFRAARVQPSNAARTVPLAPNMLFSIYGDHLGPSQTCTGTADTHRTGSLYPTALCGVQVFLANTPAGLLYVSESQVNFQVPHDAPLTGEAELKVVYQALSGAAKVPLGVEATSLSVEGEARIGAPLWIHVQTPYGWDSAVQYPSSVRPNDFGCNELEVRRNSVPLPRIALRPFPGGITGGLGPCGIIGIEGGPLHTGRLPLHLQYRFTEPAVYEVRYTRRAMDFSRDPSKVLLQSAWTPIRVLPRAPRTRTTNPVPTAPAELLSDYLPSVLASPDAVALDSVVACLYHANYAVRSYASAALAYWPQPEADARVDRELASRGPSDMTVEGTLQRHPEMLPLVLHYLKSADPALLRGALTGVSRWLYAHPGHAAAESALLAAADHLTRAADPQTVANYAAALGAVRDPRAGTLLWNLAGRGVAREQALIAITWRKDPRDLPPLAALLEQPAGDPVSRELASLPYALRNSYGDSALPYLESALAKSPYLWVRTNCARELILAGRSSGFAFVAQAIEQKSSYAREMVQFLQDRFPALRGADDAALLAFLRAH